MLVSLNTKCVEGQFFMLTLILFGDAQYCDTRYANISWAKNQQYTGDMLFPTPICRGHLICFHCTQKCAKKSDSWCQGGCCLFCLPSVIKSQWWIFASNSIF